MEAVPVVMDSVARQTLDLFKKGEITEEVAQVYLQGRLSCFLQLDMEKTGVDKDIAAKRDSALQRAAPQLEIDSADGANTFKRKRDDEDEPRIKWLYSYL